MRIINLILATLLFLPLVSNAQERELDETVLILTTANGEPYENVAEGCAWAAPYIPTEIVNGIVSDLVAVATNSKNGQVENNGENVGEAWICVGELEEGEDINFQEPPGKRVIAFALIMGDEVYGALGEWTQRTEYDGFQQEGYTAVWGGSARLAKIVDSQPTDLAGAMTYSLVDGHPEFRGIIMTVRLYEPRDLEAEASREAWEAFLEARF